MSKDGLIHIKLDYGEAVTGKRDILTSEAGLLKMIAHFKRYKAFRDQELEFKDELAKRLKDLRLSINSLQKVLPALKIPQLLKQEQPKGKEKHHRRTITEPTDIGIEAELRQIEKRISSLQR